MTNHIQATRPLRTLAKAALTATAFTAASFTIAQAESTTQSPEATALRFADNGASERIALAGELQMLSQRVVSAACFLHAGIEAESSRATLGAASAQFETITAALEHGNAALGVNGAEDRRRTLAGLEKLNAQWAPIVGHVAQVQNGTSTDSDVAAIADQSVGLLDTASRLVVQITSQYAGQTTVLQSDALRLDLAGRQRTLSQKIAKNGCLISRGLGPEGGDAELRTAADNFDVSMNALRFGMQEVGILPPPNEDLVESLDEVARNWSFMARIVSNLTAGNSVDDVTLGVMFLMSNQVTDNMARVVDQFAEASKLQG